MQRPRFSMHKAPQALSGTQVAILLFASVLLAVPVAKWVVYATGLSSDYLIPVTWAISFSWEALALLAIPRVRQASRRMLSFKVGPENYLEVVLVCVAIALGKFAVTGEMALRSWAHTGDAGSYIPAFYKDPERRLANAISLAGFATLAITSLVAPVVEELLFRGFLFSAWLRRWHWLVAMLLTSAVFTLCHDFYFAPFTAGLVLAAIYRRTGSLRAAVVVHGVGNFLFWYPLLGRYLVPENSRDIGSWRFHLAALAFFVVFLVFYVASARSPRSSVREAVPQTP
jgi:membrane protease YdiL (CAAX protease family)